MEGTESVEAGGGDDVTLNASLDDADGVESMAIACRSKAGAFESLRILVLPDIAVGRSTRRVEDRRMRGREEVNEKERRRETRREQKAEESRLKGGRAYEIAVFWR